MNTKKTVAIHILCWTIYLGYFYIGNLLKNKYDSSIYLDLSVGFVQIVEFYICYLWVYPRFLKRDKILQLIGGISIAMASFIALRYLVEEILYPHFFGFSNYSNDTTILNYIRDNIYWGASYIVISAAIWSTQEAFKTERAHKQLKAEAMKAELAFLRSQINPHFLYNTLNYIYSLALPVSEQLSSAIIRLSELMRYTLTDSADGKVSLTKEVEYMESYIELFKMRFTPNFYVNFKTYGIKSEHRIASLLLIPFVENAFKHGIANKADQQVEILLRVDKKQLYFEVDNAINNHHKDRSGGIGLINIKRRLDLIYPDSHELLISKSADRYKSVLTIKL